MKKNVYTSLLAYFFVPSLVLKTELNMLNKLTQHKMKLKISVFTLLFFQVTSYAQEESKPTFIEKASHMTIVQSLSSRTILTPAPVNLGEAKDKKSGKNKVIYGKGLPNGNDPLTIEDKNKLKLKGRAPSIVFDGVTSSSQPTDPAGAVGPDHYILVFNTGFRIFDKLGNPLTGQLDTSNIFPDAGCCDLTCSYDTQAERFVMTFLGNGVQVAVSQTSNPMTGGWNVYNFPMNTDYQKLSIWSDGYYLTANKDSGSASTTEVVYALERSKMLIGDANAQIIGFPLPGIVLTGFYSPQAFNVTSSDFPAAGNAPIVYMQDDAWSGVAEDHLKLWTVNVNWTTPSNSTISTAQTLVTTPFTSVFDNGAWDNLTQPNGGSSIDALQATIMNQAQFRKFATHNSAVFNFVVNTQSEPNKKAGVRWFELRQTNDGQPWTIYQEGTYTAPNEKHAWNASMGIDIQGNIGMGYTSMGGTNNQKVGSCYTGRYANDPLGVMTIAENIISIGNENIPGVRYGDYSKLALDPVDNKSFWFVNEYMNPQRKDVVGVFKLAPSFINDVGVVAITNPNNGTLTNAEAVTISIFNYGQNAASNFPVSYQIDGGNIITETYTGTIASTSYGIYTFTVNANLETVGQTYIIAASTLMTSDEDNSNDSFTKNVTHLYPKDVGVLTINSPASGTNLSTTENIMITVRNFGGQPQSNFPISYTLDGTIVNETFTSTIPPDSSQSYTFVQTGNFGALGVHNLSATTALVADNITSNDSFSKVITKSNCQPNSDCDSGDGLRLFQIGTINNPSQCGTNGYSDFTNLSTNLGQGSVNNLTLSTNFGDQFVTVWIDYNDDFVFTTNEKVVTNFIIAQNQGIGTYTETTSLTVSATANLGQHIMRAKTNWDENVPNDACEETNYGETEDYLVTIISTLDVPNYNLNDAELIVKSLSNNQFEITLEKSQEVNPLIFTVYNTNGQRLIYDKIKNQNGNYSYILDMSYAPKGVYLIRIGNFQFGKVKKIIVE